MNSKNCSIVIAADHRGYIMKEYIKQKITDVRWLDVGAYNDERSDYPIFAHAAMAVMIEQNIEQALLLCATGIGMAVVANRYKGIYAALVWNEGVARASKEDDNANVLVLPSDFIAQQTAIDIIQAWRNASFKGGRYQKRLVMIDNRQSV